MLLRSTLTALALITALGTARAQVIDTVSPAAGSPGQVITIDGSGLLGAGGVGTPKVFLRDPVTLKKTALSVTASSATQITAVFKKGIAGVRDVVVLPKGSPEIAETGAFEVMLPVFTNVDSGNVQPDHADAGTQVTAEGQFLGTVKGSLKVGGKKTSIVSWADGAIVFTLPTKLGNGFHSIEIKNAVGTTLASFAIIVTNGATLPHKPDTLAGKVDKKKFVPGSIFGLPSIFTTFDPDPDPPAPQVPTVTITATSATVSGQPSKNVSLNMPFDPTLDAAQPMFPGDPDGSTNYTETVALFDFTTWESTDDNYSIVVLSFTDNQFVGTYAATLHRTAGTAGNETVVLKKGKFRGTLTP